jgi:hypothetical protein
VTDKSQTIGFNHPIYDQHLAPGISKLKPVNLPLPPQGTTPDLTGFVIISTLITIDPHVRVRAFNFIRRTIFALNEYISARESYNAFFTANDTREYFSALQHFENCVAAIAQGHELMAGMSGRQMFKVGGQGRFDLNYRLKRLHELSKHTEGFIRSADFIGQTISVWITSTGLATAKQHLTFTELLDALADMNLAAYIMTKSYMWRGEKTPDELLLPFIEPATDLT